MLYRVKYTKLAIMKDGNIGNNPQGDGVAYMDCDINEITDILKKYLGGHHKTKKSKFYPIINSIQRLDGDIISTINDVSPDLHTIRKGDIVL